MQGMSEQDDALVLRGKVQVDDAYLGGEHCCGRLGLGSENKVPNVAAVSVDDAGHQHYVKLAMLITLIPFYYLLCFLVVRDQSIHLADSFQNTTDVSRGQR